LNDTPSPKLLEQITAKLNGGSLEYLKNRIHVRFDDITGLGMLEALAADVAAAEASKPSDEDWAREIFRRPAKFSETDKAWARGILAE
jgi:hypothetical protein